MKNKIHTLYFIHHSHTDIGYTHDQPIVWDLQRRFLDEALHYTDQYANQDGDSTFRWTVETTSVLYQWLKSASPQQTRRFQELEKAGRIEVTAMFANLTPLFDTDQLIETFQLLRPLRQEYGFTITSAMNCDVNGENWPLVDLLLDLGIEGFSMAINTHFGGAPFDRPNAFWWQGPSGRKIMAWNGWPYDAGWRYGIGHDPDLFENTWWPQIERRLAESNYRLPVLMVQSYHPFGDNGSAFAEFADFITTWNEQGKSPRLVMATPRMWWEAVKQHSDRLPIYRGDWTDYWNFGCISSAREQALNRGSRVRLRTADALAAVTIGSGADLSEHPVERSFSLYRDQAWQSLHLWDEHTWGADCSIRAPFSEDTTTQWHHKAGYAYTARSLSLLLQRDALAGLAHNVHRDRPDDLLVFNPLPWSRRFSGEVPANVILPRGDPEDQTAGRHFQDRVASEETLTAKPNSSWPSGSSLWMKQVEVPGYGYAVIPRANLVEWDCDSTQSSSKEVVENEYFRLTFDYQRGGIRSWYDHRLDREWVDQQAGYPLNCYLHEKVAVAEDHPWPRNLLFQMDWLSDQVERLRGWNPDWPVVRSLPEKVQEHSVYRTPAGIRVDQILEAPGCASLLKQSVFLPDYDDYIEYEAWYDLPLDAHPQATYLLYPFDLPGAVARFDVGGQAIEAGSDQLPGVCRDYVTAQGWVDFNNGEFGVTVALPDNPMVQFGDFHFAHNQAEFSLERAMLLGWITNNYWETNFRAHQPGRVQARYRIRPYLGSFNESRAHRFGLEAAHPQPLLQHLGEKQNHAMALPQTGSLLHLPDAVSSNSEVIILHIKPAYDRSGLILRLLNASDQSQSVRVGSGHLQIISAEICDLLENPRQNIYIKNGFFTCELPPRQVTTLRLEATLAPID